MTLGSGKMAWPFSKMTGGTSSLVSMCRQILAHVSIFVDFNGSHCSRVLNVGKVEASSDSGESGFKAYPTDNLYSI